MHESEMENWDRAFSTDRDSLGNAYQFGTTGHMRYLMGLPAGQVFMYDSAEDGPECETITRILAKHPLYKPGQEKHDIALWRVLNRAALLLYSQSYDTLRSDMQEVVIKRVAAGFVVRGQA